MTNGMVQNYTVTCNNSGTFTFDVTTQDEQISVTLDANFNFVPFTTYECTVSATTNGGVGNASEPSVATTEQDGKEEIINNMPQLLFAATCILIIVLLLLLSLLLLMSCHCCC